MTTLLDTICYGMKQKKGLCDQTSLVVQQRHLHQQTTSESQDLLAGILSSTQRIMKLSC